jgi:hypothetical protein
MVVKVLQCSSFNLLPIPLQTSINNRCQLDMTSTTTNNPKDNNKKMFIYDGDIVTTTPML